MYSGRRRENHSNLPRILRSMNDSPILPSRNGTSSTQFIIHLTTSLPIKYVKDELIEGLHSFKTPRQEPPIDESNPLRLMDMLNRKKNNIPNFEDIVKIYYEGLTFLECLSIPIRLSSLLIPNLNERKKGG